MNKTLKRALSGALYVIIMWFGISCSKLSFNLLFCIILLLCLFEMWRLRKGKTKILALTYVAFPLFIIQLFSIKDIDYLESTFDTSLILIMFILTWTFDTFAYLFGVKFGKHKIMPTISPKKSWEGFFGGYFATIIVSYISINYFKLFNYNIELIIITIILPFTATIGDFIASYYKREAGVKDSGKLIPGHGGILDRMDAFFITIPIFYLIIKFI